MVPNRNLPGAQFFLIPVPYLALARFDPASSLSTVVEPENFILPIYLSTEINNGKVEKLFS
jgi:hypothetical protein